MRLSTWYLSWTALHFLLAVVYGSDILKLSSFSECIEEPDIFINRVNIEYNAKTQEIQFDIAGKSTKSENVTATMHVTAYGKDVYTKDFNPCDSETYVQQLCPVPVGSFSGASTQVIPSEYADQIPSIAFSIPDIALQATIELKALDDGRNVGCVVADLSNGKSIDSSAITYAAVGVVVATLLLTGMASLLGGAGGGSEPGKLPGPSPNLTEMISWFQNVASSGMLNVNYPPLYRRFTERFAFSTGLVSWTKMQSSIDSFRSKTGGNVTTDNIAVLKNAKLVFYGGKDSNSQQISTSLGTTLKNARDFSFAGDSGNGTSDSVSSDITLRVSGIQAYVEQSGIVQENTFMTVFLIGCVACASIVLAVLLFKLILELWALCGKLPDSLVGFRRHYWGSTFRTIVTLIYLFYGPWVLYSIFQFKSGDSWAATILAATTLVLFSAILFFFVVKIIRTARRYIRTYGSAAALFEEKKPWIKYSLFYNTYRKNTWWFFNAVIAYNFIKYFLLAALNGEGFAQTVSILIVEVLMFVLYVFIRPFERKAENIINILIHFVQTLSMAGILIFVDELKVQKTTQTIMGFALIIITSVLSVILVILLIVNLFIACCANNPHRKRRKEAERRKRETDALMAQHHHDSAYSTPDTMMYTRKSRAIDQAALPLYVAREA